MPKGPKFLASNEQHHRARMKTWWEECAEVDVEALRVRMSIEYVRMTGGLSYEDRKALKARISSIQKPKDKRERRFELEREAYRLRQVS